MPVPKGDPTQGDLSAGRNPEITIGLPVYNGANFLDKAIESLLAQSYQHFELIISDNGSTDGTQRICQKAAAKDRRIRYVRHEINKGAAWNFNYVFEESKTPYFKWAAHDDVLDPTFLEKCIGKLHSQPSAVLCYPQTVLIDELGNHIREFEDGFHLQASSAVHRFGEFLRRMSGKQLANPIFGLIRAEALRKTGLIRPLESSDIVLLAELSLLGTFIELPERLFYNREHTGRSTYATQSGRERLQWFDPGSQRGGSLGRWRLVGELLGVARTPRLARGKQALATIFVGRWIWMNLGHLLWEFLRPLDALLGSPLKRTILTRKNLK